MHNNLPKVSDAMLRITKGVDLKSSKFKGTCNPVNSVIHPVISDRVAKLSRTEMDNQILKHLLFCALSYSNG